MRNTIKSDSADSRIQRADFADSGTIGGTRMLLWAFVVIAIPVYLLGSWVVQTMGGEEKPPLSHGHVHRVQWHVRSVQ